MLICRFPTTAGVPHSAKGMVRELRVTTTHRPAGAEPREDVVLTISDSAFHLSGLLRAGRRTVRVENVGSYRHEVYVFRLASGKTIEDYWAWERAGLKGVGPGRPLGGVTPFEAESLIAHGFGREREAAQGGVTDVEFEKVAAVEEVPWGGFLAVQLRRGKRVCLVRVDDEVYAVENRCTHADTPMTEGEMADEYVIECMLHGAQFDVRDGRVIRPPAETPLPVYDVKVEDGAIYVGGRKN